ncbi:hypothetical protein [Arcobacter sp.]|uniref:hypothetical protein n=1 Tax=Arcobacter sp. TaxID=1872629 RepID=UPI003D0B3439
MSNRLKKNIIFMYFISLYIYVLAGYIYFVIFLMLFNVYHLYYFYKNNKLSFIIILKSIFFGLFLFYFIIFDKLITGILLCGMDGVGYLQRSGIVDYNYPCFKFTFYEEVLLNFASSIYYPIYIFIFIKPFVNHLDKSIKKIK